MDQPLAEHLIRPPRTVLPYARVAVDGLTEDEAVKVIIDGALEGGGGLVVTPNVDHLRLISSGSWLGWAYAEADLRLPDGMPLIWASRLMGDPLPERVTGADMFPRLCEAAAQHGLSVFLLGGAPGAAEDVAELFAERWPGFKVAGTLCPPVGFERESGAIAEVADIISDANPAFVFTAMGAPKQDYMNAILRMKVPDGPWFLGVGAAFDMAAGRVQRAPNWVQQAGMEWFYRLAQEPRRMARRYLVHDLPFATRMLVAAAAERRSGR